VSESDSFIQEVSEEVRRDRLFKLMKKYGWIAVVVVILLVGGAAYNEYQKSQAQQQAQTIGDAILTALQNDDAATRSSALDGIQGDGAVAALLSMLKSAEDIDNENHTSAIAALQAVADDVTIETTYRHIVELKLVLLSTDDLTPSERIARLEPLAAPGAPYRLLAEEQIAVAEIADGNIDGAIERLQSILADGETSTGLRRRVSQLIIALGQELAPA
jgi:hypothetical protein